MLQETILTRFPSFPTVFQPEPLVDIDPTALGQSGIPLLPQELNQQVPPEEDGNTGHATPGPQAA